MATYYIGPHVAEIPAITSADTVRIRFLLTDAANPLAGLAGVTFDAAGMIVQVAKSGAVFVTWLAATGAAFATGNWAEIGNGWYDLIIRGSVAGELALLNTNGPILFYIVCTASNQAHIARKVVLADVARISAAASINLQAGYDGTGYAGGTVKQIVGEAASVAGAVGSVAGDVAGKVLGGGSGTMSAAGVRAVNSGGLELATSAEVTAIQNNTNCVRNVPTIMERPDAGSMVYRIELLLYDDVGNMEAPDAAPTLDVVNNAGTTRNANLDSTTMTLVAAGRYRSTYTLASDAAMEQLMFTFSVVEGAQTRLYGNTTQVVDTTAVDFTATDRANLEAVLADTGTDGVVVATASKTGFALSEAGVTAVQSGIATSANQTTIINRLGAWTGSGANTILGAIKALASKVAVAVSDIGGTFSPATDSLEAIRDRGDAAWLGETGNGANTVTITVQTSGAIVYSGVKVSLTNAAETAAALVAYTNTSGQCTFYLDAGTWRAIAAASNAQSGGATNFTVDGAESVTVTVTANAVAIPGSVSNYTLYDYERKVEADAVFGAAAMTVKVVRVSVEAQTDATANAMRAIMGTSYATDGTGYWGFEIAKVLANSDITIQKTWTNAASKTKTETWSGKVLASKADGSDRICFADLSPVKVASS